jgi:hypothetical protein
LVALYFALNSQIDSTTDIEDISKNDISEHEFTDGGGAVFVVNPAKMNQEFCDINSPIDVSTNYEEWAHYTRPCENQNKTTHHPIFILAPHIDKRIRSQEGVFSLRGQNIWPIDYYDLIRPMIHKIIIPHSKFHSMKTDLKYLGMSHSFIFPDLTGCP